MPRSRIDHRQHEQSDAALFQFAAEPAASTRDAAYVQISPP